MYIYHLQMLPPALFFLVPLFSILLLFLGFSQSHSDPERQQSHFLAVQNSAWPGDPRRVQWRRIRVVWCYFAIFSLTLLATLSGACGFALENLKAFALAAAESIATSFLRFERESRFTPIRRKFGRLSLSERIGHLSPHHRSTTRFHICVQTLSLQRVSRNNPILRSVLSLLHSSIRP